MVHIGISNNEKGIWYRWFIFPIIQQSSYSLVSNNHHIPIMVSNNIDHQLIGNTLFPDKPMSTHGGIDVRSYCMQKTGDVSNQNKTWCETAEPRWMRRDTSVHDQQKNETNDMINHVLFCSQLSDWESAGQNASKGSSTKNVASVSGWRDAGGTVGQVANQDDLTMQQI